MRRGTAASVSSGRCEEPMTIEDPGAHMAPGRDSPHRDACLLQQVNHALFERAPDAILLADDQARYVDANPAACELTGYSREELLQLYVWDVTPAAQPQATQQAWQRFLRRGASSGEFIVRRKDGSAVETEFRAVAHVVPGIHASFLRPNGAHKAQAVQAAQQA